MMDTGVDLSLEIQTEPEGSEIQTEPAVNNCSNDQLEVPGRSKERQSESCPEDGTSGNISEAVNCDSADGVEADAEVLPPQIGMEFDSLDSAKLFYFGYADKLGFRVRASRYRTSRRDDSIIMRRFVCYKEGFYQKKERNNPSKERRKRGSLREGCKAMYEVVRNDQNRWVVSKLKTEHTHPFSSTIKSRMQKRKALPPSVDIDFSTVSRDLFGDDVLVNARGFSWGGGEASFLLEYFKKNQAKSPAFFYAVQLDETSNSIKNVLWADARARMAYSHFGDVVALDTTYKKNKNMVPFVTFTGTNHHLHPVVFACAVLAEENEDSIVWLLETFASSMCGRHPVSFVTEHTDDLGAAVKKVFPHTRHRYCKWQILSKCKDNIPDLCSTKEARRAFKGELRKCIDEPETIEEFQSSWELFVKKYDLIENAWLHALYDIRQQWVTVYLRGSFFAEMSPAQRSESMKRFYKRNFETRVTLREFLEKFDQAMVGQLEKEAQAEFANAFSGPVLKTNLQLEKQAAGIYTKTIFSIFQEELVQSLCYSYSVDKVEDDGNWISYVVVDGQNSVKKHMVSVNCPKRKGRCSCCKFEFAGVMCRHILRVFSGLRISVLPDEYFINRWTVAARNGPILVQSSADFRSNCDRSLSQRCNDLCIDALKFATESAISSDLHFVAKNALKRAFAEILGAKKQHIL